MITSDRAETAFFRIPSGDKVGFVRREASQTVYRHRKYALRVLFLTNDLRPLKVRAGRRIVPLVAFGKADIRLDDPDLLHHSKVLIQRLRCPIMSQRINIAVLTPGEASGAEFGFGLADEWLKGSTRATSQCS